MKMTWKGEEGGPDAIDITDPASGKVYKMRPGKAVEVPEALAIGRYLGNPFFDIDDGTSGSTEKPPAGPTGATGQTGPKGTF